jgi:signal transduction histidine kinase/ActR/RegA family two-component response regulator
MAQRIKTNIEKLEATESELIEANESLEYRIMERTTLLNEVQHIAHIGNWVWNIKDGSSFWSEEVYHILGIEPGAVDATLDNLKSYILDEDQPIFEAELLRTVNRSNKGVEIRIERADHAERWLLSTIVVTPGTDGQPEIYKGALQDITERRQEREQHISLERQLQQTQKMESLGQLTGGIAHDFNNMLGAIIGFTDLAKSLQVEDKSGKLDGYLDIVLQSSERAKNLVAQMLTFSRTHENIGQKDKIVVRDFLNETFNVGPNVHIMANSVMLGQVFMNLCVNARDAMGGSHGTITIDILRVETTAVVCDSCHQTVNGKYIQITVSDTGHGMEEKIINNIFQPFFTTKEVGKGTGMGLAMIHGIMHKHNGHILVSSASGQGTTFSLLFPLVEDEQNSTGESVVASKNSEEPGVSEGERILVVDDEVAITLFLQEYLAAKGFNVIAMNDSRKALDYFMQHHDDIDLLITDYTMPGITGMQLAISVLDEISDFPIILCTGYSDYINEEDALDNNISGFLTKPIDMDKLLSYIKQFSRRATRNDSVGN